MAKDKNKKKKTIVPEAEVSKKELSPREMLETAVDNLNKEMEKLETNKFKFYFFVIDTKGVPNGSLAYIYETAMHLKNKGYDVAMLHSEKEFIGVGSWLGEEYAKLRHFNIENDGVRISPSDFLIIPELYSNVMYQTKKLPCKRIALLQNYNYLTEIIQPGASWGDYGIIDCITTTPKLEKHIKEVFPYLRANVVRPSIIDKFTYSGKPKKLFINLVTKSQSDTNRIVKEFFWRYPTYKWIAFRDIRGLNQDDLASALDEAFATVWVDERTDFGYSALQAMKAGNIVIGKIPEDEPDWMLENGELKDCGVWFYKFNDVYDIISGVVEAFMNDKLPEVLFTNMEDTIKYYDLENQASDIEMVYIDGFVEKRKEEITTALSLAKDKLESMDSENKEEA